MLLLMVVGDCLSGPHQGKRTDCTGTACDGALASVVVVVSVCSRRGYMGAALEIKAHVSSAACATSLRQTLRL